MSGIIDTVFLQQIIVVLVGVVATGIMTLVGYYIRQYFKTRSDCLTTMKAELEKQGERGIRQSRAIIAMAQSNDEDTAHLHPNEPRANSAAMVETLLKDEFGNL